MARVRKPQPQPQDLDDDLWDDIGGSQLVRWDEPKTLEGRYQGYTEVDGQFGSQRRHRVLLDNGEPVEFYAPSMLERKLEDPRVTEGCHIRITYTGKTVRTKTGRTAKEFTVQIRRQ